MIRTLIAETYGGKVDNEEDFQRLRDLVCNVFTVETYEGDFDILRAVCNYLGNASDVLSFALTCSSLTEDAFRKRLSMSPVTLSTAASVRIFYTFIFSNEPARAPCIYGLRLLVPFSRYLSLLLHSLLV